MRGAGGSFGIATNIRLRIYEKPPFVTVFDYSWTLNAEGALAALVAFQNFAQTNIPSELGVKLDFRRGSIPGNVNCSLRGGWYGESEQFTHVISPFLNNMPRYTERNVSHGSYYESVVFFSRRLQIYPDVPSPPSRFYAKSLMTPENAPLSLCAIEAFTNTLAVEGHNDLIVSILLCVYRLVFLTDFHSFGSSKLNLLGDATLSSTRYPRMTHPMCIGILCFLSRLT
jgi:hypothetical protein